MKTNLDDSLRRKTLSFFFFSTLERILTVIIVIRCSKNCFRVDEDLSCCNDGNKRCERLFLRTPATPINKIKGDKSIRARAKKKGSDLVDEGTSYYYLEWENWGWKGRVVGIIAKLDLEAMNPRDRGIVGIIVRREGESWNFNGNE